MARYAQAELDDLKAGNHLRRTTRRTSRPTSCRRPSSGRAPKQAPGIGGFGYKKDGREPGNKPDSAPSDQVTPQAVTASDWKRRWRGEKRRTGVLHPSGERRNDAEKARDELQGSLERAKSAVRFEAPRAAPRNSVLPSADQGRVPGRRPSRPIREGVGEEAPGQKGGGRRPATPGSWEAESRAATRPCSCGRRGR